MLEKKQRVPNLRKVLKMLSVAKRLIELLLSFVANGELSILKPLALLFRRGSILRTKYLSLSSLG